MLLTTDSASSVLTDEQNRGSRIITSVFPFQCLTSGCVCLYSMELNFKSVGKSKLLRMGSENWKYKWRIPFFINYLRTYHKRYYITIIVSWLLFASLDECKCNFWPVAFSISFAKSMQFYNISGDFWSRWLLKLWRADASGHRRLQVKS